MVELADTRDFKPKGGKNLSMTVYDGMDVYGPYARKDGRQHVVAIKHNEVGSIIERKTISYPKYLVEVSLGRYLDPEETVDHIDGDFLNNDLSNLRVVPRSLHAKSHTATRSDAVITCVICHKEFVTNDRTRICCGDPHCRGSLAHLNGHNKGNSVVRNKNVLVSNRSLVEEIQSVEGANSGKSLVDNPEQED